MGEEYIKKIIEEYRKYADAIKESSEVNLHLSQKQEGLLKRVLAEELNLRPQEANLGVLDEPVDLKYMTQIAQGKNLYRKQGMCTRLMTVIHYASNIPRSEIKNRDLVRYSGDERNFLKLGNAGKKTLKLLEDYVKGKGLVG